MKYLILTATSRGRQNFLTQLRGMAFSSLPKEAKPINEPRLSNSKTCSLKFYSILFLIYPLIAEWLSQSEGRQEQLLSSQNT